MTTENDDKTNGGDGSDCVSCSVSKDHSYRIFYGKGHPCNRKIHVREIVDEAQVVYRAWSKRKRYWQYYVDSLYMFELYQQDGVLFKC